MRTLLYPPDEAIEGIDRIYCTYDQDLNLLKVHDSICHIFSVKRDEEGWRRYLEEATDVLLRYQNSKTGKIIFNIGGEKCNHKKSLISPEENISLIKEYEAIANRYAYVDFVHIPKYKVGCSRCGLEISDMERNEESGSYICECGIHFGHIYSFESVNVDPDKIEIVGKSSYEASQNFNRRLEIYKGNGPPVEAIVLEEIDEYFTDLGFPAEEVRKMKPDRYGRRGYPDISVQKLKEALQITDNTDQFQNINTICYTLWGWEIPQIDHLVDRIYYDYTLTQDVYRKYHLSKSSINVDLRLYWHLRIVDHDCLIEDFKIPKSKESRDRHSKIFQKMCQQTGLPFYPID